MGWSESFGKRAAKKLLGERGYHLLQPLYTGAQRLIQTSSWHLSPLGRASRRRLRALHNAHQGKRCFVIGNGPSLNHTDLTRLENEVTVGSNGLFYLFDDMGFLPTIYTVEDQLVAEDRAETINAIRGTTKLFPWDLSYCLEADADTTFLWFQRDYRGFPRFSDDLGRSAFWGGTVTFFNLQVAFYLGCREVYLIGIDHSYKVPDYASGDVIVSREDDLNHFHPEYFGRGFRWHDPKVERMERSYGVARAFFEAHGGQIFNATKGGALELFERVDYDTLF
jgi:hypothetical protein